MKSMVRGSNFNENVQLPLEPLSECAAEYNSECVQKWLDKKHAIERKIKDAYRLKQSKRKPHN